MTPDQIYTDLADVVTDMTHGLVALLPDVVSALLMVLIGAVLAVTLRLLLRRLIRSLDRLIPSRRVRNSLRQARLGRPAADLLSNLVFWLVLFVFLAAAAQRLGLPVVSSWLTGISSYLPNLLSAALVILAGVVGGIVLRDIIFAAASSAGLAYGATIARTARAAVVVSAVLVGVDQLGFNVAVLTNTLITTLAALLFGGALAFGLGARTTVSNILASHYVKKCYAVGHAVRVGDVQGEIVEFTATAVMLQTTEGRALVPAQLFAEKVSHMPIRQA